MAANWQECSICMDSFKNPRLISCRHSFCYKCLEDYIRVNLCNGRFNCPICRTSVELPKKGISAFQRNFYIDTDSDEKFACDLCGPKNVACSRCLECEENLCQSCCYAHEKSKGTRHHKIRDLGTLDSEMKGKIRQRMFCNQHPEEEIKLFCQDCKMPICLICKAIKHENHATKYVAETTAEVKKILDTKLNQISDKLRRIKASTAKGEELDKNINDAEREELKAVDDQCSQLHKAIDQEGAKMKEKIKSVYHILRQQNAFFKRDIGDEFSSCSNIKDTAQKLRDQGTDMEIIKTGPDIEQVISAAMLKTDQTPSTRLDNKLFSPAKINASMLIPLIGMMQDSTDAEDRKKKEREERMRKEREEREKKEKEEREKPERVDLVPRTTRLHVDDKDDTEQGSDEYTSEKETICQENKEYILVAAIDLGTNFSNWACSFLYEYNKDPKNILIRTWNDSLNMSLKAPTTILVREDGKTLDKFGYEAEDKYAEFAEYDAVELHTWYYFKRFKIHLQDRKIRRDMTLESENGKVLPALRVFALTIEYLKNDLLVHICKQRMDYLDKSLIRWVLTVPTIWDESAKQFMREAAVTAGIPSNQLILALEPEVAALYCAISPLVSTYNGEALPLLQGAKFILIDAGDDTIDITAHKVISGGSFNEIYRSNGNAMGGTEVDKAFFGFLKGFFGRSVYKHFKQKHMDDYLYLRRLFEQRKKTIEPQSFKKVVIRVPDTLYEHFEKQNEQNLTASLKSRAKWSESVELVRGKMILDADIIKTFFADVLQKTRDQLHLLFSVDSLKHINIIMMVGGFSDSKMLQEMVRNEFPKKKVIVPTQAGLAVLKGAVLFGHDSSIIRHVGLAMASKHL